MRRVTVRADPGGRTIARGARQARFAPRPFLVALRAIEMQPHPLTRACVAAMLGTPEGSAAARSAVSRARSGLRRIGLDLVSVYGSGWMLLDLSRPGDSVLPVTAKDPRHEDRHPLPRGPGRPRRQRPLFVEPVAGR